MTENSALTAYFAKIGKIPLLTREQEQDLFKRIEQGDQKARDELIERNLKLVIPTAKQYMKCGIPFADLVQEGSAAVTYACDKFDYRLNNKFSTYATYWIKQRIGRYVKKHFKNVFVPEYRVNLAVQANKAKLSLMRDGIDNPSVDEIYERLKRDFKTDASRADLKESLESCQIETSLSARVGEDGDTEFGDLIEDESARDPSESVDSKTAAESIESALSVLDDDEKFVISLRYGIGQKKMTVGEIASAFGFDEQDVRNAAEVKLASLGTAQSEITRILAA